MNIEQRFNEITGGRPAYIKHDIDGGALHVRFGQDGKTMNAAIRVGTSLDRAVQEAAWAALDYFGARR